MKGTSIDRGPFKVLKKANITLRNFQRSVADIVPSEGLL